MDYPVHEETYRGYLIKIYPDDDPQSPRDWDNLGTMVCWHLRRRLGDEQPKETPLEWRLNLASQFDGGIEDRVDRMRSEDRQNAVDAVLDRHVVMLPLFVYEHGGITMSTGRFSDPWDSGQVGWIYVTKETIRKEMCRSQPLKKGQINPALKPIKHVTKKDIDRVMQCLESEVETYDQYLRNDVYGFIIEGMDEEVNSVWGFYGEEDCLSNAKMEVDAHIKWLESPQYKDKVVTAEAEAYAEAAMAIA